MNAPEEPYKLWDFTLKGKLKEGIVSNHLIFFQVWKIQLEQRY